MRTSPPQLVLFAVIVLASITSWATSSAQAGVYPHCDLPDSATVDSVLIFNAGGQYHVFGTDTLMYPNEFDIGAAFAPFDSVFTLKLTDGVSNRWSRSDFSYLISSIMDNDSLDISDDIFATVWNYFCREDSDQNPSY